MRNNIILILIIIILLLSGGGFWYINSLKNDIQEGKIALRVEKLRGDKLKKVNNNQYRKLVADSLTRKELNNVVDSLEIALDAEPKIIEVIKFVPVNVEKPVDSVIVEGDTLRIEDYYPQKEDYFMKYSNKISLSKQSGIGKFDLNPFNVNIVLSQRDDGIFQADIKVPKWLTIGKVDIQATPMEEKKVDNFGWILGAGLGTELLNQNGYGRFEAGFRWKKMYFDAGFNTNVSVDGVIKFEF